MSLEVSLITTSRHHLEMRNICHRSTRRPGAYANRKTAHRGGSNGSPRRASTSHRSHHSATRTEKLCASCTTQSSKAERSFCRDRLTGLSGHVSVVPLVFSADVLEHVAVGDQCQRGLETKRPRVIRRIVEGHLQVHVPKVTPTIAFGHAHGLTSWVSEAVQPRPFLKTGRFDYQRIALPASSGRPHPARFQILRQAATIDVNLACRIAVAREHHNLPGGLNHLE